MSTKALGAADSIVRVAKAHPKRSTVASAAAVSEEFHPELEHASSSDQDELVEIHQDVYNMFFLSAWGGQAFYYAAYVWLLKMALFTFLAMDAVNAVNVVEVEEEGTTTSPTVLAAQFLMLPVAVAMQEDLTSTFYLVANIKYGGNVRDNNPDASVLKYKIANMLRGIDGCYSLLVNFTVLLSATNALSLFLNFAALQFLTSIDNIALTLAADGYLSERLELVANSVREAKLPQKTNKFYRTLDSILFLLTLSVMIIAWAVIKFAL